MDIFQINSPIKKIGVNQYIIGDNQFDPLALINGKELVIDTVTAKNLDAVINKLSGDISEINDLLPTLEETPDLELLSGIIETIRGLLTNIK